MNKSAPHISVLIPTYNGEAFISEAIESVLSQTCTEYELIISDDVSSDGTADIVSSYVRKHPHIQFTVQEKNLGCMQNINWLLIQAKGRYIKILIQDDVLHSTCLEKFSRILDEHPDIGLVTSYQQFIGDWHTYRKMPVIPAVGKLDGRLVQKHMMTHRNWIGGETATMFRKSLLISGLLHAQWGWVVDMDLWMRILRYSDLFVIPDVLTYPRMHQGQGTVYLDKNFSFLKEELEYLTYTSWFPDLYPQIPDEKKKQITQSKIKRVMEEEYGKGNMLHLWSLRTLGFQYDGYHIYFLFFDFLFGKIHTFFSSFSHFSKIKNILHKKTSDMGMDSWKKIYSFVLSSAKIKTGHGKVEVEGIIQFPLSHLKSTIVTDVGTSCVPLSDTVHSKWIHDIVKRSDDTLTKQAYTQYLSRYFPEEDIQKTTEHVRQLANTKEDHDPIIIYPPVWDKDKNMYVSLIYDGNHRAACALAKGKEVISCYSMKASIGISDMRDTTWISSIDI